MDRLVVRQQTRPFHARLEQQLRERLPCLLAQQRGYVVGVIAEARVDVCERDCLVVLLDVGRHLLGHERVLRQRHVDELVREAVDLRFEEEVQHRGRGGWTP